MIRKKVLSIGNNSATLLVQDTEANGQLRVLRRISVANWSDSDVRSAEKSYEVLRHSRLRGFVPIHTVLVQNSFLSVVASYAAEGDVTTYLEEEMDAPLDEQLVLCWLCACALSVREMHRVELCFPGLTTDRLFLDHQTGGTAQILLGVPLPLPVYMLQVQERRKNGINVHLDYPPEVLSDRNGAYHTTLSDVWSLGRLGEVLLTAKGTNLARRSGSTRQLIVRMMASEPTKRPSMESVAQSLIAIAGNVKLGKPSWPAQPSQVMAVAGSTTATTPKKPSVPSPPPPPSSSAPTGATAPAATSTATSSRPPSSRTFSPPPEVPSTRLNNDRHRTKTATTPADVRKPPSPNSLPVPSSQIPTHHDAAVPAARPPYAPDDSWHRRAQLQFEQLQQLNASPPKLRGGDGPVSPRNGNLQSSRRASDAKSPSPRRGSRGSLQLDNNTRMLNEMFAAREKMLHREADASNDFHNVRRSGQAFHVEDLEQLHLDTTRQMKSETAQRQQEMRKHFMEWQRQNNRRLTDAENAVVMEQDGVVIVAPRLTPAPAAPAATAANNNSAPLSSTITSDLGSDTKALSSRAADAPSSSSQSINDPSPSLPPKPMRAIGARTTPVRTNKPHPKTPSSPKRQANPKGSLAPSPRASLNSAGNLVPAAANTNVAPVPSIVSPRSRTNLQLNSVQPQARKYGAAPTRRTTLLADEDPVSKSKERNGSGTVDATSTDDNVELPSRKGSVEATMHSTVEWSIDGLRSTLRTLLRDRNLYGEVMQEVSVFVNQREEARLSAHTNELFAQRLRRLLPNERLFHGAVSLCAQLVALEGLDHTLKSVLNTRSSR